MSNQIGDCPKSHMAFRNGPLVSHLIRISDAVDGLLLRISGIALFVMMIIVVMDVVLRYFFNAPQIWVHDFVVLYLLSVVVFLGLNNTMRNNGHIAVDLFLNTLSPTSLAFAGIFINLIAALVFGIFFYITLNATLLAWVRGEEISGLIAWPIWPSYLPAPIGFGALLVLCLQRVVLNVVATIYVKKSHEENT